MYLKNFNSFKNAYVCISLLLAEGKPLENLRLNYFYLNLFKKKYFLKRDKIVVILD